MGHVFSSITSWSPAGQRRVFESSQRMTAIIQDSFDAIVSVSLEGVITSWNPAAERMYGYPSGEIIGRSAEVLVAEDETEIVRVVLGQIAAGQHVKALETRCLRKDGVVFPITFTVSAIRDIDGAVVGASAIVRDLTGQRRALETAQLTAAIIEHSQDAIVSCTSEGIATSWNPAAERMFGYSTEEIIGSNVAFLRPRDRDVETQEVLAKVKAGQPVESYESCRIRKDGTLVPVAITVSLIYSADGAVVGASGIYRDLTAQRQAFEANQRMAAIVESSADAIIGKTLDGIITSWNRAAAAMFGYSSQEIIGKSVECLIPEDKSGEFRDLLARKTAGEHVNDLETTRLRKDGMVILVSVSVSPILDTNGVMVGASSIIRDLTEQRVTAQYSRSLIETALDPLVAISPDGLITDVNEATVKITGIPRSELIGTSFSTYFTEPDKANEMDYLAITTGVAVDYPLTMRHRNGRLTEVLYNAAVYRDINGRVLGVFAAARDVTKQMQATREISEQRAREQETLEELMVFRRVTVGRELKMMMLKKENESLRGHAPFAGDRP